MSSEVKFWYSVDSGVKHTCHSYCN